MLRLESQNAHTHTISERKQFMSMYDESSVEGNCTSLWREKELRVGVESTQRWKEGTIFRG